MANFEEREQKLLAKISDCLEKLDETLDKMEATDSKVKDFFEQEKALHEIRVLTRKEHRIEKDEEKAKDKKQPTMNEWIKKEQETVDEINQRLDALDADLAKIKEDEKHETKVKSYLEQKEAIKDIKDMLQKAESGKCAACANKENK